MKSSIDPSNFTITEADLPPAIATHGQNPISGYPRLVAPDTLEGLRHRLPDYLAACGVELRRHGARLVGRCPVHDDRTPSFAVFGAGHEACGCYPCGFTGDVFAVAKWLGRASTFPNAVADVAATLGVHLSGTPAGRTTRPATPPQRSTNSPAPPFSLTDTGREQVRRARLAFSDAFHGGDAIIDRIAESLGLARETLRLAAWGSSGLGLACPAGVRAPWLCYAYPQGLKWRNPDPKGKQDRFRWLAGKALAPWRWEWVKPDVRTVYVTEGESDCLALIESGLEDDGTAACVASPGTSLPREWAEIFAGKRVVLCFDLDPPGQAATAAVAEILAGHAAEVLSWKGGSSNE